LVERGLAIFPEQTSMVEALGERTVRPVRSAGEATERLDAVMRQVSRRLIRLSERSALVLLIDDVERVDAASRRCRRA
jgi:hypothetical protein